MNSVPGGCFLIARSILGSSIWRKPPQYVKLWCWLIGRASFQDGYIFKGHSLNRGELIVTLGEIAEALSYTFNRQKKKPTEKEIRVMLEWMVSEDMISKRPFISGTFPNKGTHLGRTRAYNGILISIVNYDSYQDYKSYEGTDYGTPSDELGQVNNKRNKKNNNTYAPNDSGESSDQQGHLPTPSAKVEIKAKAKLAPPYYDFETRQWVGITDEDWEGWNRAYPACNVERELYRMGEWLLANPLKRKKNYRLFITRWLTRTQDKGGG